VASRLRQALSDTVLGAGLAGDGLLVRLRRATIALLATVAAVGLGLIAFVSQVGWPTVLSGPIPAGPEPGVLQNAPIAAARPAVSQPSTRAQPSVRRLARAPLEGAEVGAPSVRSGSEVGSSRPAEAPPAEPAPPAQSPPQQAEAPDAAPEPVSVVVSSPSPAKPPDVEETRTVRASKAGRPAGKQGGKRGHAPKAAPPPPQAEEDDGDDGEEDKSAPGNDDRGSGHGHGHGKPDWAGH
jgi:hypothetical protein